MSVGVGGFGLGCVLEFVILYVFGCVWTLYSTAFYFHFTNSYFMQNISLFNTWIHNKHIDRLSQLSKLSIRLDIDKISYKFPRKMYPRRRVHCQFGISDLRA